MQVVSIIGLGLMGGSLGLALKALDQPPRVVGYARREETREKALRMGVVDEVCHDLADAVKDADVSVFCVPILTIPKLVVYCRDHFKRGSVVTDVGSTKAELVCIISDLLKDSDVCFVGSHPIAGSEQQGVQASNRDLYRGAVTVITPAGTESSRSVEEVRSLWEQVGSGVCSMGPEEHDTLLARTSHLPHMMAAALVRVIGRGGEQALVELCCGTGFKDTTRIAEGSADVWKDIVKSNRHAVLSEMEAMQREWGTLIDLIRSENDTALERYLLEAAEVRKSLIKNRL